MVGVVGRHLLVLFSLLSLPRQSLESLLHGLGVNITGQAATTEPMARCRRGEPAAECVNDKITGLGIFRDDLDRLADILLSLVMIFFCARPLNHVLNSGVQDWCAVGKYQERLVHAANLSLVNEQAFAIMQQDALPDVSKARSQSSKYVGQIHRPGICHQQATWTEFSSGEVCQVFP